MLRQRRSSHGAPFATPPNHTGAPTVTQSRHPPGVMQIKRITLTSKKNWWMGTSHFAIGLLVNIEFVLLVVICSGDRDERT